MSSFLCFRSIPGVGGDFNDTVLLYAYDGCWAFHTSPSEYVRVVSHATGNGSLADVKFDVIDHILRKDGWDACYGDGVRDFSSDGWYLAVVGAVDMGIVVVVIHHYSHFSFLSSHIRAEDRPAFFSLCFFSE